MPIVIVREPKHYELYKKIVSSVVFISNLGEDGKSYYGGGFIYDSKTIVTCAHVVYKPNVLTIETYDGRILQGTIKTIDEGRDLATIEIATLPVFVDAVKMADITTVEIGEPAVAIGHPFKQKFSFSKGVISQVRPEVVNTKSRAGGCVIKNAIQTDTALNPGNSGAPLFDYKGRVIGIASFIIGMGGDSAGVAYAIPTPEILKFVKGG